MEKKNQGVDRSSHSVGSGTTGDGAGVYLKRVGACVLGAGVGLVGAFDIVGAFVGVGAVVAGRWKYP